MALNIGKRFDNMGNEMGKQTKDTKSNKNKQEPAPLKTRLLGAGKEKD